MEPGTGGKTQKYVMHHGSLGGGDWSYERSWQEARGVRKDGNRERSWPGQGRLWF